MRQKLAVTLLFEVWTAMVWLISPHADPWQWAMLMLGFFWGAAVWRGRDRVVYRNTPVAYTMTIKPMGPAVPSPLNIEWMEIE